MNRWAGVVGAAAGLLLAGCGSGPAAEWSPGPVVIIPATSAATPSPAESTSSTSPAPAGPTVPDAEGALDVGEFDSAHFASPTGRIWCALEADWALCHFPDGMDTSQVPAAYEVCPEAGLDVTGVSVQSDADYFCSGGAEALPQTDGDFVEWWRPTGFPSVKYEGQKLATLPYGKKLVRGDFVCLSEKSGVTCGNIRTHTGFTVSRAGVTLIG